MKVWIGRLVAGAAALAAGSAWAAAPAGAFQPVFKAAPCTVEIPDDHRGRVTCGTVDVPRDHADPAAGAFRLAVVVGRPEKPRAGAAPVYFLHGGPGGGSTKWAGAFAPRFAPGRTTVVVDQRGAGASQPALCTAALNVQMAAIADDLPFPETVRRWRRAYVDCRAEAARAGLKPEMFGTSVTVQDLDLVRRALGHDRIAIYGASYGTALGMDLIAARPQILDAAVLDSVYPPDAMLTPIAQAYDESVAALFAACARDAACAEAYPDLPAVYARAIAGLERENLAVPVPGAGLPQDRLHLSGREFELFLHQLLYDRSTIALAPELIEAAAERRTGPFAAIAVLMKSYLADLDPLGFAAVECRDRARFQADEPAARGPELIELYGVCSQWSPPGPAPRLPQGTTVPTLVLAGELDPITRPEYGRRAAAALGPSARFLLFPNTGHGARSATDCGRETVSAFLDAPSAPLKTCNGAAPRVAFVTDAVPVRGVSTLALETASLGRPGKALALTAAAVVALLFGLVWPLIAAAVKRSTAPLTAGARVPAALSGLAVIGFVGGLGAAGMQAMRANEAYLAFGLPQAWAWITVLPWLAGALALWGLVRLKAGGGRPSALALTGALAFAGLCALFGLSAGLT